MNVAMFTNTYTPFVGGVARSVQQFAEGYRERSHRVLVVAPEYDEQPEDEQNVVRLKAVRDFAGSGFSVALPISLELRRAVDQLEPDLLHSHFPFLIGDVALRLAASRGLPLVFTYHTMYEHYAGYAPVKVPGLGSFAMELAAGYADLCDHVLAPSESVREILKERGIETSISVVPTGVEIERFRQGDGDAARQRHDIPLNAFVIGHVGRLAPEKNLEFLARAVSRFLAAHGDAHAIIVGGGTSRETIEAVMRRRGVADRLHCTGVLKGRELADAYHAFDAFAFASLTETQGVVLVEALATGCPVVALDAPGARDVVRHGENGRLVEGGDEVRFASELEWIAERNDEERERLRRRARESADPFNVSNCVERALSTYRHVLDRDLQPDRWERRSWDTLRPRFEREWDLWTNRLRALAEGVQRAEEAVSKKREE